MKKNGFAPIIILVLIALAVAGYFGYKNYWPKLQSFVTPTPTATADPTANWKTYTNAAYGFSFKYPDGWSEGKPAPEDVNAVVTLTSDEKIGQGIEPVVYYIRVSKSDKTLVQKYTDIQKVPELSRGFSVYKTEQEPSRSGMLTYLFTTDENNFIMLSLDPFNSDVNSKFLKQDIYQSTFDQILSTFKFTKGGSPAPSSAGSISYTAPSGWQRFTTQNGLKLCLPPKWESNPYGTLTYNRDAGYQPQITIIQNIPYTSGSYADAYYNFWRQEYPNVSQLVTATQTNINGNTAFKFAPMGEAKTPPEGLTVVWFTSGKLWKAGLSNWSMINSSQTAFLKDFYTMINCSF